MANEESKPGQAGSPAGRFCPTCRSPMLYTGDQRQSNNVTSTEERCSMCGFTAWKRQVMGSDKPAADRR